MRFSGTWDAEQVEHDFGPSEAKRPPATRAGPPPPPPPRAACTAATPAGGGGGERAEAAAAARRACAATPSSSFGSASQSRPREQADAVGGAKRTPHRWSSASPGRALPSATAGGAASTTPVRHTARPSTRVHASTSAPTYVDTCADMAGAAGVSLSAVVRPSVGQKLEESRRISVDGEATTAGFPTSASPYGVCGEWPVVSHCVTLLDVAFKRTTSIRMPCIIPSL